MGSGTEKKQPPKPPCSLFDLSPDLFVSGRVLLHASAPAPTPPSDPDPPPGGDDDRLSDTLRTQRASSRWTCNTCAVEFESLPDQRSHFKTDLHRLNVKLHVKGKNTIKEEDFMGDDSLFKDGDISSISGSEDELEIDASIKMPLKENRQKLVIDVRSGETVILWSCVILDESETYSFQRSSSSRSDVHSLLVTEEEVINRLQRLLLEPRNQSHLIIVLLARGGHFAGCVFDGNNIVAHKTFHRYVVRAKAGRKQSSKDATGRAASSAGSSLRRYNEAALKKEIQELLVNWKKYFASSECILIHAPSKNAQLIFDGENSVLTHQKYPIRHIPLTVRRPTLKEAKRVYYELTQVTFSFDVDRCSQLVLPVSSVHEENLCEEPKKDNDAQNAKAKESSSALCPDSQDNDSFQKNDERMKLLICMAEGTPLHDATKSGNAQQVLELLEQGSDPTIKDSRGKTAYLLAKDKEIRNIFRRFMASNPDKWNWHAASVPSALTKEMEESQALRQAEKDAKRKAKAKELKKLRKAKEKAQAEGMLKKSAIHNDQTGTVAAPTLNSKFGCDAEPTPSNEEERKRALDIEREKRAAAAERRIAALKISQAAEPSNHSNPGSTGGGGICSANTTCSCCHASLAGKIPFHRYDYKYCSTTCMHVHREMLEDG